MGLSNSTQISLSHTYCRIWFYTRLTMKLSLIWNACKSFLKRYPDVTTMNSTIICRVLLLHKKYLPVCTRTIDVQYFYNNLQVRNGEQISTYTFQLPVTMLIFLQGDRHTRYQDKDHSPEMVLSQLSHWKWWPSHHITWWRHQMETGPLCGEFTCPRWIPRTKASDAELWCFLGSVPE